MDHHGMWINMQAKMIQQNLGLQKDKGVRQEMLVKLLGAQGSINIQLRRGC